MFEFIDIPSAHRTAPIFSIQCRSNFVHLFTFEAVVSGVEGEDGVGAGQGIPEIALFAFPQLRS